MPSHPLVGGPGVKNTRRSVYVNSKRRTKAETEKASLHAAFHCLQDNSSLNSQVFPGTISYSEEAWLNLAGDSARLTTSFVEQWTHFPRLR